MLDQEKEQIMRTQLNGLYSKIDEGESLNQWEQMAYDIYCWILEDSDEPSLD